VIPFKVSQQVAMPRMAVSRDEALLETTYLSRRDRDFIVQKCGAGTVLVLMKFGVPEYETWFHNVVEPTVQRFGTCIRLDKDLSDWKSVAVDTIRRSDCVIIDLSFHLLQRPSENVLWELQELFKAIGAYTSVIVSGVPRDRVAFCCSGLDGIRPGEDWITIREISHEWLPLKPKGSVSDVLGPTIRKYRTTTDRDKACFTEWIESILSPWVQRVPPPLNLATLRESLLTIAPTDLARALWQHDLSYCADFMRRHSFSQEQISALAQTLTTVSVADVYRHTAYWDLVGHVFPTNSLLREHIYRLLRSEQLALGNWVALSYRDSFWKLIERIAWKPSSSETATIMSIADSETNNEMHQIACLSSATLLPDDKCKKLQTAILMSIYGRPFPKLADYVPQ
jgi:hypothetical protein